jgi:hypothetical protein
MKAAAPPWAVRLAAESAVVIFSVLLALAVDEWRSNRALERQVEQTRGAFAEEIAGNLEMLRAADYLPYHQAMWDHFKLLSKAYADRPTSVDSLQEEGSRRFNTGVHPPPLRDAVWRSIAQSDLIRHMDAKEVFALTDVYNEQNDLAAAFRRMLDVWLEPTPYRHEPAYQRDDVNVTRIFLADVVAAEGRLLAGYDSALALLRR